MTTMRHIAAAQGCPFAHRSFNISDIDKNMLRSPTDSAPWEIQVPQKPSAPLIRLINGGVTPEVDASSSMTSPLNASSDPRSESDEAPSEAQCPLSKSRQPGTMLAKGFRQMHQQPDLCSPEEASFNASVLNASTSTMALSVSPSAAGIAGGTWRAPFPPLDPAERFTSAKTQQAKPATGGQCPYRRMVVEAQKEQPARAKPATPEPTRIPFAPTGTVLNVPRGGYTLALLRSAVGLPKAAGLLLFLSLPLMRHVVPGVPHVTFASVLVTLLLAWFANYVWTNVAFWARHLHRDEEECRNSRNAATKPFLSRRVEVRDHHVVANKSVFAPVVTADYVHRRAFATVGLTVRAYLRDLVTYALEYKIQAVWRLIAVDLGLGQYAAAPTGETLYRYVINTSVGCFIDAETGHVELYDTCLPYKTSGMKTWHRMVLELDHDAHRAVRLLVQETRAAEGERPVVLVLEDMMELHAIMTQVGMLKTHVHVHWFANGVAELTDSWALAEESSDMVQGLNNGAIFSTEGVYQNKTATMATMTAYNVVTEGLPVHNDLRKYGEHSLLHKMSVKARLALYEVLPKVPRIQIEALVAATLMHSADHYYAGTSLSYLSRSELLQCDFTLARSTVMSPNRYRTRKLLCREHLDDPVCRALYLSAVCVDPEFANGYLFLAVAN